MQDDPKTREFIGLLAKSQRRLYAFIRSLVYSPADADDVLQEASTIAWQKFEDFEPGTDFTRWMCRIARLEVFTLQRNRKRLLPIFSDEVLDELMELTTEVDERIDALNDCRKKLRSRDQELLHRRYGIEASIREIAQELGRTESAIYKSLQKIHDSLFDCIEKTLGREGAG